MLMLWCADLARRIMYATIRGYLHGLRSFHVERQLECNIADPLLKKLLTGIRRVQGERDVTTRTPITIAIVQSFRPFIQSSTSHNDRMLYAAIAVAVGGLFRVGELTVTSDQPGRLIRMRDVTDCTTHLSIKLQRSKTDPFGRGCVVRVAAQCALRAFRIYRAGCSSVQRQSSAPLFAFDSGRPLSRRALLAATRKLCDKTGVDIAAGGRGVSFRRGGATSLAEQGVPDRLIKAVGRWKSFVYARYIEDSESTIINAAAAMDEDGESDTTSSRQGISFTGQSHSQPSNPRSGLGC
jgi:hypothetical protein